MNRPKLTRVETKRLQAYIKKHDGQQVVAVAWGVNASTLSRIINGHHAPSPMLAQKLEEVGVVK